jgi:hypothetical protein
MPGVKALRKIQMGQETTAGTAVVATTVWRGMGVLKDDRELVQPDEDIGLLVKGDRIYVPRLGATLAMDEVEATFEQLPYLLAASIEKTVTGAADGGGSGKIYQFDVATTVANAVQTFTIEMGDDQRVDEVEYAYVEKFTLSGSKGEAVMMGADWRGRQATDCEFTGSVSAPTVEEILFSKGKLYIDPTTIGTTQKTATWLGFSLDVPGGWKAVYTGDGALYFTQTVYKGHKDEPITGEITLEHDATAEAEIAAARAGTLRLIRMTFDGTALTTAGTSYTYKTLKVDMAVKYTDVPELGDEDEDDIVALPFEVVYNSTAALAAKFIVVNQSASLT